MIDLFPQQSRGVKRAVEALAHGTGGFYLMHDPGGGKTLSALLVAKALGAERPLVLGPLVSLGVWQREAAQWLGQCVHIARNTDGWPACDIVATNYEQLLGERGRTRLQAILRAKPDLLILDEAQAIKSPSSQTRRAVERIAKVARRKLLLSGTAAHSPLDWWVPMRMIAPDDEWWESRFQDYRAKIAVLGGPNNLWVRSFRWPVVREAVEHMKPHTDTFDIRELNLPKPIASPVLFPLQLDEAKRYRAMDKVLRVELAEHRYASAELVITKLLRLHQMTGGHVTDESGRKVQVGVTKLEYLQQILKERRFQKVLIACRFRWEVERIASMIGDREGALGLLSPMGMKHVALMITGDTPQAERSRIEALFQASEYPIALILQYKAGGMSLTLSKARALIFYSFDRSVIAFRQMIGRVWRPGLEGAWQIIPLLAEGTIDVAIWEGLVRGYGTVQMAKHLQGEGSGV